MTYKFSINKQPYKLESIVSSEPPTGAEGNDWYRYTIIQGQNTIQGCRQGKLKDVTEAVEENVDLLNERQLGKRGRVDLVNSKKAKPKT
jgi:hypothetical protein